MEKLKAFLAMIEEHGLLNKTLDKLLTPEMMKAIAAGFAEGLVKGASNANKS